MFNVKDVIAHKTLPDMVPLVDHKNDNNLVTIRPNTHVMFNTMIHKLVQQNPLHSSTLIVRPPA